MVRVAVQQGHPQTSISGIGQERSQPKRRRLGKVLVGITEAAVHLERNIERDAFLGRLEQKRMTQGGPAKPHRLAALRPLAQGAEADAQ